MICREEILSICKIPVKDNVIFVTGLFSSFWLKIYNELCGFHLSSLKFF